MVRVLPKQERESVPQTSSSHNRQHRLETEHVDASLVAGVKQLLDQACQGLPVLSSMMMSRLASSTSSSRVELSKKIPQLGGIETSGRIGKTVVGQH